jgi:hypothetical protein
MTTADIVKDRALALVQGDATAEDAVVELLDCSGGNRVAVVIARRHLLEESPESAEPVTSAAELLGKVLLRLPEE